MPADNKGGFVGIAKMIGVTVAVIVLLTLLFSSSNMAVVERISGYLVVLGIVLGVFQYFAYREEIDKPKPVDRRR